MVIAVVIALFEVNIGVWLHVTSNITRSAELVSFNVAHSDDAIMHLVALLHHPRDTLKDLTLAGHVTTITYWNRKRSLHSVKTWIGSHYSSNKVLEDNIG